MEALSIGHVGDEVCLICKFRFHCYTTRSECKLTVNNVVDTVDREGIKKMQIIKAKKQGHYLVE